MLRPERDFLENSGYLNNLVKRINAINDYDSLSNDKSLLQEIMQADYYVNRLIRLGDKDIYALQEVHTVLQGVLDTIQSKRILSLNETESKEINTTLGLDDLFINSVKLIIRFCMFTIMISVLLKMLSDGTFVQKIYNDISNVVNLTYSTITNDDEPIMLRWNKGEKNSE